MWPLKYNILATQWISWENTGNAGYETHVLCGPLCTLKLLYKEQKRPEGYTLPDFKSIVASQ